MRWRTAWFAVLLLIDVGSIKLPQAHARIVRIAMPPPLGFISI